MNRPGIEPWSSGPLGEHSKRLECSPIARETWVQSQVESYQRLKKWYLMPPCLTLSIIRYGSRVKWSNPGKGVAPSPTPWCSSYRKGSLRVTLDYDRQLYFTYIYIYSGEFLGVGVYVCQIFILFKSDFSSFFFLILQRVIQLSLKSYSIIKTYSIDNNSDIFV